MEGNHQALGMLIITRMRKGDNMRQNEKIEKLSPRSLVKWSSGTADLEKQLNNFLKTKHGAGEMV